MDKQGFIDYLQEKNFVAGTINRYTKHIDFFLQHAEKEDIQITKADVLKHLEYLKKHREQQNITRSFYLTALKHYFTFLCKTEQICTNPCAWIKIRGTKKKALYKIYSPEELDTLFDNYYMLFVRGYDACHIPESQRQYTVLCKNRNILMLSILIYQGTTTGEVEKIDLDDVDLSKATVTIQGGRKGNKRILPLQAAQMGLLINYLQHTRPQLSEYHTKESNRLFLSLPPLGKKTTAQNELEYIFRPIAEQVKSIDKQFLNFKQVRASVITNWLKAQGLRKAQYLAGHRQICCTERYITNDLTGLIDDINTLHPF